jgi:hypothetical protein
MGKLVERANEAAATASARDKAEAGEAVATPAAKASAAKAGTAATVAKPGVALGAETAGLPTDVRRALAEKQVLVLLFWAPNAPEDRDVREALRDIDRHHGQVAVHVVDVADIAKYQLITRGADVTQSPTVVVVDPQRRAQSLVGYVDTKSIDQAVADAVGSR